MARLKRILKWIGLAMGAALIAATIPIAYVETQCFDSPPRETSSYRPILPPEERRAPADTFLTYPEWSIVHAYEDLAAVSRTSGESAFDYIGPVRRYWSSLCALAGKASAKGPVALDVKAMLYIIGVSFSAEFAVKGLYETTIGHLTATSAGSTITAEDRFAHDLADDYAAFLRQTPWYEYPFGAKLIAFWWTVPFEKAALTRSIERRIALSLEWGAKSLYARLMALAADAAPAKLTLRSIISALDDSEAAPGAPIRLIERRVDGSVIIETPRYRAFTAILLQQLGKGRDIIEIAGNDHIFVTVLMPAGWAGAPTGRERVLVVPIQARAGWERHGVYVPLSELGALAREVQTAGGVFEHAYDY
ncbi:MAG: hypothetical protein O9306_13755 [Beijerinckiaceae bacterium]|jgi:hypothetical protein|nr:hypothetical protein [Beijerinckiaceae bacterium]